jgi:plasmid stabilization system protein ParE
VLNVLWSDEAVEDLIEVIGYIEERNETAALRLKNDILGTVERLPGMPYMFKAGRVDGTREAVVHPNYIVIYLVGEHFVEVLNIVHSRKNYPQ